MARKEYVVAKEILADLKNEIQSNSFVDIVDMGSCKLLSSKVYESTKHLVSSRTIYRIFIDINYSFNPSRSTLDIFSQYCGYTSISDFIRIKTESKDLCLSSELEILKGIYDIDFKSIKLQYKDKALFEVTRNIVKRLRKSEEHYRKLIPIFGSNPVAQNYFVEQFVDYDNLNGVYASLLRVYLKSKNTNEAILFANCLLYLASFLSKDMEKCKEYFNIITSIDSLEDVHPFVVGRYYAVKLLHNKFITNRSNDFLLKEIYKIEKSMPRKGDSYLSFPGFHFNLADALVQCELYDDVIKITNIAIKDYPFGKDIVLEGFYPAFYLFRAIAFFHTNEIDNYCSSISLVDEESFTFLSEKYYTIQLNKLLMISGDYGVREVDRLSKSTSYLIEKTGFVYFLN